MTIRLPLITVILAFSFNFSNAQTGFDFESLVAKADSAYSIRNWSVPLNADDTSMLKDALARYRLAFKGNPENQYVKSRINEIVLALYRIEYWDDFKINLKTADSLLLLNDFQGSRLALLQANKLFPSELDDSRLKKINLLIELEHSASIKIDSIKFGSNHGMCIGYCFKELTIRENSYQSVSKNYKTKESLKGITNIDRTVWDSLAKSVQLIEFLKLSDIIGCPDCLDQGSEWIKVYISGQEFKTIYDYDLVLETIYETQLKLRNFILENKKE